MGPVTALGHDVPAFAVVGYGTAVGVLVDLDHLFLSRLRTGDWRAVRFCLSNPVAAVADQDRIFEQGEVGVLARLLSHLLLVGLVVPLHLLVGVGPAILVAVVLYVHLVADVAWDLRRPEVVVTTADRAVGDGRADR